jgi:hypothetical protein
MIGLLGKKFHKKVNSFMCSTLETAASAFLRGQMEGQDVSFTNVEGIYVVAHKKKYRLESDNTPIHRQVICNGIKAVLEMLDKYFVPGQSHLLGVKTDAIWVKYPRTHEILEGYRVETSPHPEASVQKARPEFDDSLLGTSEWEDVPEDQHASVSSAWITGPAGSGKTTLISKVADKEDAFILAPTWTAVDNLFQKGFERGQAMSPETDYEKRLKSSTDIVIDEYTMASIANLSAIAAAVKGKRVLVSGDPNQCMPVGNQYTRLIPDGEGGYKRQERNRVIYYDRCQMFKDLCGGKRIILKHREGGARYGKPMKDALNHLLDTGYLPDCWEGRTLGDDASMRNIVRTNKNAWRQLVRSMQPPTWGNG